MINKKYHTVGTVSTSNRKIIEKETIDTLNTNIHDRSLPWLGTDIHDRSLPWLGTGTSIKRGGDKLVI
jgi:hypothetical protein